MKNPAQRAKAATKSLRDLYEQIFESIDELKFKGIEFVFFELGIQIKNKALDCPIITVEIKTTAQIEDSRFFLNDWTYNGLKLMFELIEYWKDDIYKKHQPLMKSKTLF